MPPALRGASGKPISCGNLSLLRCRKGTNQVAAWLVGSNIRVSLCLCLIQAFSVGGLEGALRGSTNAGARDPALPWVSKTSLASQGLCSMDHPRDGEVGHPISHVEK